MEEDPLFIEVGNFIFNNEKLQDVQFIVGGKEERIKAVKILLINQSKIWWVMLSEDSLLAEKGDIRLPDIEPEVFTLMLRHCYGGLSKLDDLSDEVVVDLCYCANKYSMKSLMAKIAPRLQPKDVDSVFPALHCLTFYNLRGVEESVKKIVQAKTTEIFGHPEFLECSVDSIVYICKQDPLNCNELTIWKAVVSWAKHKAEAVRGADLRQWLSQPLKHIRLLTCSSDELKDICSAHILSPAEICWIGSKIFDHHSFAKNINPYFPSLCSVEESRNVLRCQPGILKQVNVRHVEAGNNHVGYRNMSIACIKTNEKPITLESVVCRGYSSSLIFNNGLDSLFQSESEVSINIEIKKIPSWACNVPMCANACIHEPIKVHTQWLKHFLFESITIPTVVNGFGVNLNANSKYLIKMSFNKDMPCWIKPNCIDGHRFDHGTFFCCKEYYDGVGTTGSHILRFNYGVAKD